MKGRRKEEKGNHDIVDLTSITNSSATSNNRYICKGCKPKQILLPYPQAQIENPFAGPSFRCPNCNRIYDSSLVKLSHPARQVRSTIGSERDSQSDFIIDTVAEDKGLQPIEDEYEKYDPEGDTDFRMEREGFHIIESKIELTDSSGMNRTVVKRSKDESFRRLTQRQQT